jgi:dissimilatory sulfite reductase (desulfoviridin) alpha/beta subunit
MVPRSQVEEAIKSIQYFAKKLGRSNKDLTKNQIKTLMKVAKGLISSIETELNGELGINVGGC